MRQPTHATAIKFEQLLRQKGLAGQVVEFEETTRSAADAAAAIGCEIGQIVKSLIFRTAQTGRGVLVLTSGANRVAEKLIEAELGESLGKADADFVRTQTGYAIGGVPPFDHAEAMITYIDEDFFQYKVLWAAAGTPNAVFELSPQELAEHANGKVLKVKQE
jgi:prolyl-tRNA editing enzyme YbaK/EbsC (Cys-tRNA(Pro) deacylase)